MLFSIPTIMMTDYDDDDDDDDDYDDFAFKVCGFCFFIFLSLEFAGRRNSRLGGKS